MKILITGGHLGTALGVIDEMAKENEIIFIGRKYALDQEKTISLEYLELTKRGIKFYSITTGRLTRLASIRTVINFLKIPTGFVQAYKILKSEKPDIILSFGSYIALPVCLVGYLLRIPIFTHEQTLNPGLTNRIIAKVAKKIFVSFPEAEKNFPKSKVVLSGNPVRSNLLTIKKKVFNIKKNKPVIYFTGGSLGSHSINNIVEKILNNLVKDYIVIHQTGNIKEYNDFQKLTFLKEKLNNQFKENYYLKEHFFEDEIGYIYATCDLVVGRSGANTFFELLALKKPAIFIPLPWSAGKEQLKHAELFFNEGAGEIFNQSDKPENLIILIKKIIANYQSYKINFKNLDKLYKGDAAKIIFKTIKESLQ